MLSATEARKPILVFSRIELTTSALVSVRGYLLDHSGDEGMFLFLFVSFESPLQPMGLNMLGYQSHLLQRYHPACGHEESSHLSPVLALRFFIAMQVPHSCNTSTNG